MADTKFTPGPWEVEDPMGADVGLWIVQGGLETFQWSCITMVMADEDKTARDYGGRFIGRQEQKANARLIAAAPDLLAVAQMVITLSERWGEQGDLVHAARAALAKARGEQP